MVFGKLALSLHTCRHMAQPQGQAPGAWTRSRLAPCGGGGDGAEVGGSARLRAAPWPAPRGRCWEGPRP